MLKLKQIGFLPIIVVLITVISVNLWSIFPIENMVLSWGLYLLICISVLWNKYYYFSPNNGRDYLIIRIYIIWMIIGVIRGCFVAENYWEWKELVSATFALSLPIFVYAFSIPLILQTTLSVWIKFALPAFGLFFIWAISRDAHHFYLGPILLLGCFIPALPKKWKYILLGLLFLMLVVDLTARSQTIKAAIVLLISAAYYLSRYTSTRIFNIAHWFCYIIPIVFLTTAIMGVFNPFQALEDNEGKYMTTDEVGEVEDLAADTRTGLYEEIVSSAVRHNYIWQGRTPARGNDSWIFGSYTAEELKTGRYERHSNEFCHPNIFTWLGLIGVVFYGLIYLRGSYLALYKSNSVWMKLIGVFIAFRWAFGWIEDTNSIDISNIALWMMIAMGFSEQFRAMSNTEMEEWVCGILKFKSNK